MLKKLLLVSSIVTLTLLINACGGNSTKSGNAGKPTNANTGASTAKKEPPKPQTTVANKPKPPDTKTKDVPNKVPVPKDWVYYSDEVKGYGFYLPEGSTGETQIIDGVDAFRAVTPSGIEVIVFAWKDKTATKESLLDDAERVMNDAWGETVTAGKLQGESDDYAVAEASSKDQDGKKYKMKVLVGTDVTDNYVMFVYTDEDKFDANRQIIDEIWGNFEMYSGGASGHS